MGLHRPDTQEDEDEDEHVDPLAGPPPSSPTTRLDEILAATRSRGDDGTVLAPSTWRCPKARGMIWTLLASVHQHKKAPLLWHRGRAGIITQGKKTRVIGIYDALAKNFYKVA